MGSLMELNRLLLKFFLMSLGLVRCETGDLTTETYLLNPIVSSKQQIKGAH